MLCARDANQAEPTTQNENGVDNEFVSRVLASIPDELWPDADDGNDERVARRAIVEHVLGASCGVDRPVAGEYQKPPCRLEALALIERAAAEARVRMAEDALAKAREYIDVLEKEPGENHIFQHGAWLNALAKVSRG